MRMITILGSTGSIGVQSLEVIKKNPKKFKIHALSCSKNINLLIRQALEFDVKILAVSNLSENIVAKSLQHFQLNPKEYSIFTGPKSSKILASMPVDIVLNAITGSIGLEPTLSSLEAGNILALANKESLVIGGPLIKKIAKKNQIIPVDSEHSALMQCLMATNKKKAPSEISRLILTASGGPFIDKNNCDLKKITPSQALKHPTWNMGKMITTNSATLINKGLEVIEAHILFEIPIDRIHVVLHPQSIVHSMVEFIDGSTIAQLSSPDMKLPISLALSWPYRINNAVKSLNWEKMINLNFRPVDNELFPAILLAKKCAKLGKTFPAIFNAANEEAVIAFHKEKIKFLDIVMIIKNVVNAHMPENSITLNNLLEADKWARKKTKEFIEKVII